MEKKGISAGTLKLAAVFAMLLDHTAWCILDPLLLLRGVKLVNIYSPLSQLSVSPVLCIISPLLHTIGRITFPIMLFALCEGAHYSKNKRKYVLNMFIFALISEIPFNLAFRGKIYYPTGIGGFLEGQNVFITLAFALITLLIIQRLEKKESYSQAMRITSLSGALLFFTLSAWYIFEEVIPVSEIKITIIAVPAGGIVLFVLFLFLVRNKDNNYKSFLGLSLLITAAFSLLTLIFDSDYAFIGVSAAAIMFLTRKKQTESYLCGCAYLTAMEYVEMGAFLALPLIKAYNGKRGISLKYLFYIFYPAHLLALWAIRVIIL